MYTEEVVDAANVMNLKCVNMSFLLLLQRVLLTLRS